MFVQSRLLSPNTLTWEMQREMDMKNQPHHIPLYRFWERLTGNRSSARREFSALWKWRDLCWAVGVEDGVLSAFCTYFVFNLSSLIQQEHTSLSPKACVEANCTWWQTIANCCCQDYFILDWEDATTLCMSKLFLTDIHEYCCFLKQKTPIQTVLGVFIRKHVEWLWKSDWNKHTHSIYIFTQRASKYT